MAAAAIVLHHSQGNFGLPKNFAGPLVLDQAVSFFFVLSGFILTYVHPRLAPGQRAPFLWARLARVWPAHLSAFLLLVGIFGFARGNAAGPLSASVVAANLSLLQAWIPLRRFFFSFNGVSWSVSVEAFFYLTFPFLLHHLERTWFLKLPFALLCAVGLVNVANAWQLPLLDETSQGLTMEALVYINPLARWFEFVLGMTAALAWRRIDMRVRFGPWTGTMLEVAGIVMVAVMMYATSTLAWAAERRPWIGPAGALWLLHGGFSAPCFAVLIVVMALDRGLVSRCLGLRGPVLLGEISYSIYLIHFTLLRCYWDNLPAFASFPGWLSYGVYWMLLLLISYLVWLLIERPCRTLLVAWWPIPGGRDT